MLIYFPHYCEYALDWQFLKYYKKCLIEDIPDIRMSHEWFDPFTKITWVCAKVSSRKLKNRLKMLLCCNYKFTKYKRVIIIESSQFTMRTEFNKKWYQKNGSKIEAEKANLLAACPYVGVFNKL